MGLGIFKTSSGSPESLIHRRDIAVCAKSDWGVYLHTGNGIGITTAQRMSFVVDHLNELLAVGARVNPPAP